MNSEEIRGKDDGDLELALTKARRELFDLRIKTETGDMPSPSSIRAKRKAIARIETILRERTLGIRGAVPHKG